MGGGSSSTTTVRKRDPESEELKSLQSGIYNLLAPLLGIDASAPTSQYQSTINDAVKSRVIPTANTQIKMDDRGNYYYDLENPYYVYGGDENPIGFISDFRIYDRVLTDSEILNIYKGFNF